METRKPVDMQVPLFHADCNGAKKGSGLKRSQSAENKKLQRQSLAQQPFQTKLLVIFTKQPSWCHLFMFPIILSAILSVTLLLGESFFLNNNQYFHQLYTVTAPHPAPPSTKCTGRYLLLRFYNLSYQWIAWRQ